jgi:hypothetical protein
MDSSTITNTNKRRQQQQQQSTTKEEQIPPCTNKQTNKHNKKFLLLCKNCKFCTNTKFSHQLCFVLFGELFSFAELQVLLHQHNCMKCFGATNTSISHVPNWKFVGTNQILFFPIGKLELPTNQSFFWFLHAWQPFCSPTWQPFG